MTNCKNCPYTDEYCASGDCNKIQAKDVACNEISLTEQWKKGKLNRNKIYYYETPFNTSDTASGYWLCNHCDTEKDKIEILGEVPSYEEWKEYQNLDEDYKRNVQLAIRFSLEADILKELLKECKDVMNMAGYVFAKVKDVEKAKELIKKIDEVLK